MENLTAETPQKVLDALKQGRKIAIFVINDEEMPIEKISDIKTSFSPILSRTESLIEPALRYIKNNYSKDIKLEYLSELCQLSPNYFCGLFSQNCGKTVKEHIKSLRLKQACSLLKNTPQSIVSIAVEVGYTDCGYFNKVFKKEFGITPVQYRKIITKS